MSYHRDPPRYTGPDRRGDRTPLNGPPKVPPAGRPTTQRATDRHAAIGKIPTFSSYREWVNEMRSKWDPKE
jgi:hypothetical protein